MKPLDAPHGFFEFAKLLASAKKPELEAALAELSRAVPSTEGALLHDAALAYARAAWALREGSLELARAGFEDAAKKFGALGEQEASELCTVEVAVSLARRGRRESALAAEAMVAPLEAAGKTPQVRAHAALARGTAYRVLGEASLAQGTFARALTLSAELPEVRSMVLNALGTLCVTLAAYGAADTLCEHAAELCRLRKDVVGEAIAMGQLGAAALGRGDLQNARKFLSRQEWLAAQIGDVFGQTRALVWLAETALEAGRADDAAALATRALESARSVDPPLSTFAAYADRVLGRARITMGERAGRDDIARACATFASQRLPLGEALSARDFALAADPPDRHAALEAMASLAALGLPERVAEALPRLNAPAELELAIAAPSGRRLDPLEARLVYDQPEALAAVAEDRAGARKNLARLAILALREPGLTIAALMTPAQTRAATAIDDTQVRCAYVGGFPGMLLLAWPLKVDPKQVAADLRRVRDRIAAPVRLVVTRTAGARVTAPSFGGGLGASVEGVEVWPLVRKAQELADGACALLDGEAEPFDGRDAWTEAFAPDFASA